MSFPDTDLSRWFTDEVQPHEPALRAYLRQHFPSLSDIDDFVQETYAFCPQFLSEVRAAMRKN